jgi:indole-3-glycerol phosphate synthase
MSHILNKIAEDVRVVLNETKKQYPFERLREEITDCPQQPSMEKVLRRESINIIAEVKLASPSEGDIALSAKPELIAKEYIENGAAALSVLTEQNYFKGSPEYLVTIRNQNPKIPIIQKDFIIDEYQIYQAKKLGASAILLIASLLNKQTIEFTNIAKSIGLEVLVEIHDSSEIQFIGDTNLIGINNRNLKTMTINIQNSIDILPMLPKDKIYISESGIYTRKDIDLLRSHGFNGFLVGTSLMKSQKPGKALFELLKE